MTSTDDETLLAMVQQGLGITILPRMSLTRCPEHVCIKELDILAYRNIGLLLHEHQSIYGKHK